MKVRTIALLALSLCALAAPCLAQDYKTTFVPIARGVPGVLYEQLKPGPKAATAVLAMHVSDDYLTPGPANACVNLARRGYTALCANTYSSKIGGSADYDEDRLLLNVKSAVAYLRTRPSVRKVVLFGHSGGGGMMAAYQNIAENGLPACQGPEKLIKCSNDLAAMPAADGVMLIDASLGMAGSTLLALDPAVVDETNGQLLLPELDMFNPKNGFNPKGSTYSPEFKARFFAGQAARMNRLIAQAQDRLAKISAGQGRFADDEPFVVPGGVPAANKLLSQDVSLMAHTRGAWPLLHPDGTVTVGIVPTVRVPEPVLLTSSLARAAMTSTVKRFLSTYAVRPTADFGYDASSLRGYDYKSSYAITLNSVGGITKPLLQMGMTGSHEFFFAESVRELAVSPDKTLAYVEGARHGFTPCTECAVAKGRPETFYGDTVKTLYDYIDGWLSRPGRL